MNQEIFENCEANVDYLGKQVTKLDERIAHSHETLHSTNSSELISSISHDSMRSIKCGEEADSFVSLPPPPFLDTPIPTNPVDNMLILEHRITELAHTISNAIVGTIISAAKVHWFSSSAQAIDPAEHPCGPPEILIYAADQHDTGHFSGLMNLGATAIQTAKDHAFEAKNAFELYASAAKADLTNRFNSTVICAKNQIQSKTLCLYGHAVRARTTLYDGLAAISTHAMRNKVTLFKAETRTLVEMENARRARFESHLASSRNICLKAATLCSAIEEKIFGI